MLSERDNTLLSEVGPGKPMGELFRRFWQPVMISEELPAPDCTPVAIRILGEDLVAFRDTSGKPGVMSAYCPHRHAHLFWGRNEKDGLRCTYHGWKFDTAGNCVDMPNEPVETNFRDKIKIRAYPTRESGGCIWAYMGPKEHMPADIPHLEWALLPSENVLVTKRLQSNNWAQAVEGGIDSSHISYLHNNSINKPTPSTVDKSPLLTTSMRDFGFVEAARRRTEDGKHYWRVRPFLVPSSIVIPGGSSPDRNLGGHVWVPVDDHHVWTYTMTWNATRPITDQERADHLAGFGTHAEVDKDKSRWDLKISNSWSPIRNIDNNYMINREQQRMETFTGIKGVGEQDCSIQESMGEIAPRWEEHLGTTDRGIIEFRKLMLQMVRDLMDGKEPTQPHTPDVYLVRSTAFTIDPDVDWEAASAEYMKVGV